MIKKLLAATALGVTAVMLTVGSTWAFECYNASRSDTGNINGANGQAQASLAEILGGEFGLCQEGIDHILNGLEAEGFDGDALINFRSLMGGGLERNGNGEELLHDGKGIDHLGEDFFELADQLISEAFPICIEGA